jgi:hypothetical protein
VNHDADALDSGKKPCYLQHSVIYYYSFLYSLKGLKYVIMGYQVTAGTSYGVVVHSKPIKS